LILELLQNLTRALLIIMQWSILPTGRRCSTTFCLQVEGAQLQSEIAVKSLEAELAGVKKDLAQYEATSKTEKAKWGADLEDQKYEVSGSSCQ
jgi:hypothetical protein